MPLFVVEMRSAMLVAKRKRLDGMGAVPNFRSLDIARQSMDTVATDALIVNQLYRRPGRHLIEVVPAGKRVLDGIDDRLRKCCLWRSIAEAVAV